MWQESSNSVAKCEWWYSVLIFFFFCQSFIMCLYRRACLNRVMLKLPNSKFVITSVTTKVQLSVEMLFLTAWVTLLGSPDHTYNPSPCSIKWSQYKCFFFTFLKFHQVCEQFCGKKTSSYIFIHKKKTPFSKKTFYYQHIFPQKYAHCIYYFTVVFIKI